MADNSNVPTTGSLAEQMFFYHTTDKDGPVSFACAFTYDRDARVMYYAGSAFRPNSGSHLIRPNRREKDGIRHTAHERLVKCPVVVPNYDNPPSVMAMRNDLKLRLETFKLKGSRSKPDGANDN